MSEEEMRKLQRSRQAHFLGASSTNPFSLDRFARTCDSYKSQRPDSLPAERELNANRNFTMEQRLGITLKMAGHTNGPA